MSDTQSVSNLEDNCTNDLISISLGRKLPVSSTPINDQIRDKPIQTSNNYIHLNTEEKQIQELLDYDENSSDNDVPEYNPDSSSIKEHPECQNCEFLRTYINHCEEAMNSLQEELYQIKSKDKNNSPSSRLKGVDADKSESASTIKDKSTDHGKKKKKTKTYQRQKPQCLPYFKGKRNTAWVDCFQKKTPNTQIKWLKEKSDKFEHFGGRWLQRKETRSISQAKNEWEIYCVDQPWQQTPRRREPRPGYD